jgi:hypothetical protein
VLALLALLTAGALALRLVGIGYLLPFHQEPDGVIVWQASYLEQPVGEKMSDFSWPAPFYPQLLARMLTALPGHSHMHALPETAPLEDHLAAAGEPYRRGRYLIAVIATLAVPATFFLARFFLAPGWSLLAAAFMATSLLNLMYSQQARPHCASTTFSLLAMLPIVALVRSGSFRAYVAAGVLAGITLGCLQNGVFVVPALVLAHVLSRKRNGKGFAAALAIVAVAIAVFYRYLLEAGFTSKRADEIDVGGQSLRWDLLSGAGFGHIFRGFWSFEPVLCVIASVGLAIGITRIASKATRPDATTLRELAVVLAFPISFALLWGWWNVLPARFVNPLIPYLCILGAFGVGAVATQLTARAGSSTRRAVCIATSLVALAVPSYASIKLCWLRAHEDTLSAAARWLERTADKKKDVILYEVNLSLPLLAQAEGLEARPEKLRFPWDHYQLMLPPEATGDGYRVHVLYRPGLTNLELVSTKAVTQMLAEEHAQFAAVIVPSAKAVGLNFTRDTLRAAAGEPAFACLPYDLAHTELNGSGYELGYHAFERVMRSDRWGPPVEVYRLPNAR